MAQAVLYEALGLQSTATISEVKTAYRSLAKTHHPDKLNTRDATAIFQQINYAYHAITSATQSDEQHADDSIVVCEDFDDFITIRQNLHSFSIDIDENIFLVLFDVCKQQYPNANIIDRGSNGVQLIFPYISPNDSEVYGSTSLTFYTSTSLLHVQGSSHILWVEEHFPFIY